MRKAIFAAVVLGIMGWLGPDCSAQSYGIPQESRFQPVITPGDGTRLGNEMLKGKSSKQAKQKKKTAAKPKAETAEEQDARREREKDEKELEELAPKLRTWTDTTGKSTVEATFVDLEEDQVTLKKKGGKEVTVPLARLSKNDQEWAKAEARFQEIIADYTKKVAETETKRAALQKEQKELVAKYGPVGTANEKIAKNLYALLDVPSRSDLRKKRDLNIKKSVNAYCVAIGKEPLYVANSSGDLEERGLEAAREARRKQREEQAKTNGTPRLFKVRDQLRPEIGLSRSNQKRRRVKPEPLPTPRPRGTEKQHLADAPMRERGSSTASTVQEPCGSGWSFVGKQRLDATRQSDLDSSPWLLHGLVFFSSET